ncbi:ABC transporter ATP-binding protein [Micromonospora echinospora]|uniref:ABC transporter ATP-binding protein n=1 Tax=Micromonospora echinospora TaxID=1877 RepID=UPI00366D4A6A
MKVTASAISVAIDGHPILDGATLAAESGTVTGLIGPNGSGKSTLLRCVYQAIRPHRGTVLIGETDLGQVRARQAGQLRAVVAQDHELENDYSVRDVVAMGRIPHQGPFDRETEADRLAVERSLSRVGMSWARSRLFSTLSGGERQRVLLARALAQQAPVLLLDEPTNHLDIGAQLELLELVRGLRLTTVCALHDLDHAIAYCDTIVLLDRGQVIAVGTPTEVLTPARLEEVFGVRSTLVIHPLTGRPHLVFAASSATDPYRAALPLEPSTAGGTDRTA